MLVCPVNNKLLFDFCLDPGLGNSSMRAINFLATELGQFIRSFIAWNSTMGWCP